MAETMITEDLPKEQFINLKNSSVVEKKVILKPYTTSKIKSRNLLSNIGYNSENVGDISTEPFALIHIFRLQKISIHFLWKEKSLTKATTKQYICFGKIVCLTKFISLSLNKKPLAT